MSVFIRAAALLLCASIAAGVAHAKPASADVGAGLSAYAEGSGETSPKREREGGQAGAPAKPAAEASGKELLTRKCFQCHQASMWSSLRQDRKEWEGVLYRMVGRGALWTEAEINAMATFLAETRGPAK